MAFGRKRVGVKSYKRVSRVDGAEGVVESEEARQVVEIGDECRPD